jgi:hypothetical protein
VEKAQIVIETLDKIKQRIRNAMKEETNTVHNMHSSQAQPAQTTQTKKREVKK